MVSFSLIIIYSLYTSVLRSWNFAKASIPKTTIGVAIAEIISGFVVMKLIITFVLKINVRSRYI